jgi:hypothetical protein
MARYTGTYDSTRQVVVIVGAPAGGSDLTYEWNGQDWQAVDGGTPYTDGTIAYLATRDSTLSFGGTANNTKSNETWERTVNGWSQLFPTFSASARDVEAMTFDAIHGQVVMFGGTPVNSETWVFSYVSTSSPTESCTGATVDSDGDGLAGCADPDCWGRCTPFCPPRTTCDNTLPSCGDGVCGPVEDKLLCPTDC